MIRYDTAISSFEIVLGIGALALSVYAIFGVGTDPHGIAAFTGLMLAVFGCVAIVCGVLARKTRRASWWITHCIFATAFVFIWIELFTSHTGWWVDL